MSEAERVEAHILDKISELKAELGTKAQITSINELTAQIREKIDRNFEKTSLVKDCLRDRSEL